MYTKRLKTIIFPLLLLTPLIIALQYFLLKSHFRYAFADVDWMFLLDYKQLSLQFKDPLTHLINGWDKWGVYTYQIYYIGLIEQLFGLDYRNFQIVTLIFKTIATLSIFPVVLLITKSKLAATLTTILYAISYSSVGVMYTVVTSGLFVAIPVMSLFFIWYWYLITKGKNSFLDISIGVVLFSLTLFLATERMYPLVPVVALIELFWWFKNGYSKTVLFQGLKRMSVFLALFLAVFLYRPSMFTLLSGNTMVTYEKFMSGNWQILLTPIISFGSTFLPREYWPTLGIPDINGFFAYLTSFLSGPFLIFSLLSIFLSFFLSRKPIRFILETLAPTLILAIVIYLLATHHLSIPESVRMSFDFANIIPAVVGVYAASLTLALFMEWLRGDKKDSLLISMVGGVAIALVFIIATWILADWVLIFTGVHRYLTIPAMGSSLLIGGLMTIIFKKFSMSKSKLPFAYMTLLLLIPLTIFNAKVISEHMRYELEFTGTDAKEHIRMKNKLWSYLDNFSKAEPSLFYFDESADYDNGYLDETTIMAGFNFWMRFRGSEIVDAKITPTILRSNLICPEPRSMCLGKVKELVTIRDGVKGILYGDIFYKSENFYAFRFVNRDIVNIKSEVAKAIGLE